MSTSFPLTVSKAFSLLLFTIFASAIAYGERFFSFAHVWLQDFHWISFVKKWSLRSNESSECCLLSIIKSMSIIKKIIGIGANNSQM
jgi:hypothetical protein